MYKPFLPHGEKEAREGRAPFSSSSSFFSFSRRAYPSYRLTAVSHYGSIWSAFRNLVISFDRYNLNPAIAKQTLKEGLLREVLFPSLRIQAASWFAKLDNSINPHGVALRFIRCDIYTPISIITARESSCIKIIYRILRRISPSLPVVAVKYKIHVHLYTHLVNTCTRGIALAAQI